MTDSKILSFLAAAKTLNFTKAAEQIHITQPVLSRQIAAMERELEVALFIRRNKSVFLTPAGAVVAEGLSQLMTEYDRLIEKAREIQEGYTEPMR